MGGSSKLCGSAVTLRYESPAVLKHRLDDILSKPAITMEQEFSREISWTDWKGRRYSQLCQGPARLTQQPRGGGIPHRPGPCPNPLVGLSRG